VTPVVESVTIRDGDMVVVVSASQIDVRKKGPRGGLSPIAVLTPKEMATLNGLVDVARGVSENLLAKQLSA
jgi:hypothetical protein